MLYTRKGDQGTTKLFNTPSGERVSKSDPAFELLGTLDELNSWMGVCKAKSQGIQINGHAMPQVLHAAQENLFIVQAEVAGSAKRLAPEAINDMEEIIDFIEHKMPPITSFVIPGASELGALLDVTRAIARRMERRLIQLEEKKKLQISPTMRQYANRLSSLLYALARFANTATGEKEPAPKY